MARIRPLYTVRYDLATAGSLDAVTAPPYDVIDAPMRAELLGKSALNVVEVDLPEDSEGGDPYLHAQTTWENWLQQGVLVREREPAIWALTQDYRAPDGRDYTRHGFFAAVKVEDYGAGRIRPHERTHPGPKQDRLNLTRATRANLSPIFSLFPDFGEGAWKALEPSTAEEPFGSATDADGTVNTLWRVSDPGIIEAVTSTLSEAELLIADGHHRYETARAYAEEVGGEGPHEWVLMFLCSLTDPGLTIFPTHRLVSGLDQDKREALRAAIEELFEVTDIPEEELQAAANVPGMVFGYLDAHHRKPLRLTLRDHGAVDQALPDKPAPYRRLDTAVLETLILKGALGMSDEDIDHKHGLDYSKNTDDARAAIEDGRAEAVFFMRPIPVEDVREVAASGESMPPKSTYFFPKIPTGLVFNPLE
ncbi:MAG: DUF1015 domain-containing protein [Thermoleophilaceae bacterium]|nr:DUF1015 domain-containing protein [Thermoleophilaceae bacterium]